MSEAEKVNDVYRKRKWRWETDTNEVCQRWVYIFIKYVQRKWEIGKILFLYTTMTVVGHKSSFDIA